MAGNEASTQSYRRSEVRGTVGAAPGRVYDHRARQGNAKACGAAPLWDAQAQLKSARIY